MAGAHLEQSSPSKSVCTVNTNPRTESEIEAFNDNRLSIITSKIS